jgi:RNA polymerase sigma factor (sigma-70 family)
MSDDKQLLERMRRGDKDALRQIYEKYRDDMFTAAVSLLRDIHGAEDCLQDVFVAFVNALNGLNGFNVRSNLKGYLISSIANRAKDYLRKRTPRLECPLEELSSLASTSEPDRKMADAEFTARLLDALSELPYEQQQVFVLRTQGGMKFREIAKLEKISIKTIQTRYRYAIEKLRNILEKENTNEVCN